MGQTAADSNPLEAYNSQIIKMINDRIIAGGKPQENCSVFQNSANGIRIVLRDVTEVEGYTCVASKKSFEQCIAIVNEKITNVLPNPPKHHKKHPQDPQEATSDA